MLQGVTDKIRSPKVKFVDAIRSTTYIVLFSQIAQNTAQTSYNLSQWDTGVCSCVNM